MRATGPVGCFAAIACIAFSFAVQGQTPTPGQNVNMVSGRQWPGGDPWLQRQNEASVAVSSRNPLHFLAGANDYRTVDLPLTDELPNATLTGDAWLGLFKSFNGGQTWQSTLIPGYPQDLTPDGLASPLKAFPTASDPVVRSGTNGLFYYGGIAFNRATSQGIVFVSRFIDLNNRENGTAAPSSPSALTTDPIRFTGTFIVDHSGPGQFLDKPWMAVDVPRAGALTCNLQVSQPGGTVPQTFLGGNVYIIYTKFTLDSGGKPVRGQLFFSRSRDCGATWSTPSPLFALDELRSGPPSLHQGATLQVDPQAGFVYAAWRRFKGTVYPDSILAAVSIDGGHNFTPGIPLVTLPPFNPAYPTAATFFDQRTTATSFRTNAFPALAVDDSGIRGLPGRVYFAWSQRLPPSGDARITLLDLPGGILLDSSGLSLRPYPIDTAPLKDDAGVPFDRGHQFMPQLAFTGGKLVALYYDMRLDHTYGTFAPTTPLFPDSLGRFFLESRVPAGELPGSPSTVFTPFVDDLNPPLAKRRHTMDVMVAEADPGLAPVFTVARVSRYKSGTLPGSGEVRQLQFNPGGLPLFKGGTVAFLGDLLDIASQTFTVKESGSWAFNTARLKSPFHVAVWTSNQDVRPPPDHDWTTYTPPVAGAVQIFLFPHRPYSGTTPMSATSVPADATQFIVTIDLSEMTDSSTSYAAVFEVSYDGGASWQPLASETRAGGVALDANGRPITLSRLIANFDKSKGNANRFVRGAIDVKPSGAKVVLRASVETANRTSVFDPSQSTPTCAIGREGMRNQNIYSSRITEGLLLTSPQNSKPLSATVQRAFVVVLQNFTNFTKSFRLTIANQPAGGGFASFVQAPNTTPLPSPLPAPTTILDVTVAAHSGIARSVFAIAGSPAIPNASITVNAEEIPGGLSAFVVLNADGTVPPLINPEGAPTGSDIGASELYNPDVANPDVANPNASKSAIPNPDVANPDVANPDVANPDVANPDVANPDVANVNTMNPDVANPDVANALVSDATYTATNVGNTTASYRIQLVGSAPASAKLQLIVNKSYLTPVSANCVLREETQNTLQTNILHPTISNGSDLGNPDVANPDVANATFSLQPGESALITLRGNVDVPTMKRIVAGVTPVVIAHAANTGTTTPAFSAPLTIRTTALPDAFIGQPYAAALEAFGGTPPYSWRQVFRESGLPFALQLGTDGVISGTVNGESPPGTYTFTVEVDDAAGNSQRRDLSIEVIAPIAVITASFPVAIAGFYYSTPPALAGGGTRPYSWAVSGLPAGLVFDPATGAFSGSIANVGNSQVTLTVTDSAPNPQRASRTIDLSTTGALLSSGPGAPTGGDFISRGFYIPEYPGSAIGHLELAFGALTPGLYEFRVTLRSGSYDGPIIATSNGPVNLPASDLPNLNLVRTQFFFPNNPIERNTLVTFSIDLVNGPAGANQAYYAVRCGDAACGGPAIETEDTTPPLSVFRRNGVWIAILGPP